MTTELIPAPAPAAPVKRRPGRPKGSVNKMTAEMRETIIVRGRPIELLADICAGRKIRVGPQSGPGAKYVYPTLEQRRDAARDLLPYCVPKLASIDLGGGGEERFPTVIQRIIIDPRTSGRDG